MELYTSLSRTNSSGGWLHDVTYCNSRFSLSANYENPIQERDDAGHFHVCVAQVSDSGRWTARRECHSKCRRRRGRRRRRRGTRSRMVRRRRRGTRGRMVRRRLRARWRPHLIQMLARAWTARSPPHARLLRNCCGRPCVHRRRRCMMGPLWDRERSTPRVSIRRIFRSVPPLPTCIGRSNDCKRA